MKLIFAIKTLAGAVGGAERVLCAVCSELASRGHEVTLVTFDAPGGRPFFPLSSIVRRMDLGLGNPRQTSSVLDLIRRIPALRCVCANLAPDVAVGFMHSMFVPMALALAKSGIPLIGSEHIVPDHYRGRPLEYVLLVATAPLLARATVLTERIRESYPRVLSRRMVVIPNPVAAAAGRADPGAAVMRRVLLSVGRLEAQKDHATLIEAFARLQSMHPQWTLRIIGRGELRPQLEQQANRLGIRKLEMPGVTDDMAGEYMRAQLLVTPSRYESFGLVTAEAMSFGLPVVGFADCPGTNELIRHGENGLLIQGGGDRAGSLANGLERLMVDANLRRQLGEFAFKSVHARFSLPVVTELWEALLSEVSCTWSRRHRSHSRRA